MTQGPFHFDDAKTLSQGVLYKILEALHQELAGQKPQLFLWMPVFLGCGIAFYYALMVEPPVFLGVAACILVLAALVGFWNKVRCRYIFMIFLCFSTGYMAAQIRSFTVYTPMLQKDMGPVTVQGKILSIEKLEEGKGSRLVLGDLNIEDVAPGETPRKIRLTLRKDEGIALGQRVEVLAGLHKPSAPVIPGGFDFQHYMFFQGIGAVGFIYKPPVILQQSISTPLSGLIERLRYTIEQRVFAAVDYPESSIAAALLTGRRTAISNENVDAMRESGLAHLLAISGLHVGLFAGVIFFFSRLMMVLVPGVALHHPVKKYAAILGFLGACAYMLLAGATIPTQRAVLMVGVVFLAILLDRMALSLRLVAFAAIIVLLFAPESLMSASFQMSFGAVAALVVFYESIRGWLTGLYREAGWVRRAALYFLGVCMTTVVASTATAPFALYHFNQMAVYSLLANAIAMPLMAFIIMPFAVLALFVMPLGLEYWPLAVMEFGVARVLETALWVSSLPHSVWRIALLPHGAFVAFITGSLFLMLWKGRLRLAGLAFYGVAVVLTMQYRPPDILISSKFELVGFFDADGRLNVSARNKDRFVLENWESAAGLEEGQAKPWPREGTQENLVCGEQGCRLAVNSQKISFLKSPSYLAEECNWADLILSFEPVEQPFCGTARMLDKYDAWSGGAHAIWLEPSGIIIKTSESERGKRPWTQ